ncbi:transporter substrate-binding domain-containing protein [Streptomyces sp. 3MP-14]|uniref:Transporter substrate-binding domain-containing protein n=1 Tax=Streptomyces mimosae TaxID=2586635 RepID=A0A5N6A2G4_9ACTN|nr:MULTISPECIES: serine/threonine-protein kinase [Streptomyces]KAB8162159.1 transporter substrate-binding domain-containing protein [Streptomyces mimosae]KAB8173943.1 transporter substrate-binding domain-containing protein [Streptomyces sp. 3MP-14]
MVRPLREGQPTSIGPYRLLGQLGAGGMGRVFLGRSPGGRLVAIKLVHDELAADPAFRRRFRHEVAAARRVAGEWTAPVLDGDTGAAVPWVATGYVPGPALAAVVAEHGPLPEPSVWSLLHGLTLALTDIHAHQLVHRDLKPANILITLDGPRVIDFGIVRAANGASRATRTGSMVGSPGYMAPEQIRGETITPATDVFALGAVLAYAATGVSPFAPDRPALPTVLYRVVHEAPELGPADGPLTGALRELTVRCLAKDPAERPPLPEIRALAARGVDDERVWLPPHLTAQLGREAAQLLALDAPGTPAPLGPAAPGGLARLGPAAPGGPPAVPPPPAGEPPGGEPPGGEPPAGEPTTAAPAGRSRRTVAAVAAGVAVALAAGLTLVVNQPWSDGTSPGTGTGDTSGAAGAESPSPPPAWEGDRLTVRLGTWSSPLSFAGPDGEAVGVEPDIARALGEVLGVELEIETVPDYNELVQVVSASGAGGEPVIGLGAFRDTAAKRAELDVSYVDHFREGLAVLTEGGPPDLTLADLCGQSVVTWDADDILAALEEANAGCDEPFAVATLGTLDEMEYAIGRGEHAAAVLPYATAQHFLNGHPDSPLTMAETQLAVEPHGIMLPASQEALAEALRQALQTLIDDGTHAEILAEWGVPELALPSATINAGD